MSPLWALAGTGFLRARSTGNTFSPLKPATYRHSRTKPSSYYLDVLARDCWLLLSLRGQSARFPTPWPGMALHYTYITWLHGSHGSYVSSNRLAALYCWSDLVCVPLAGCIHPTRKAGRQRIGKKEIMSLSLRQYRGDPEKWSTVLCSCGSDLGLKGFRGAGKWQVARLAAGGKAPVSLRQIFPYET